MWLLWLSMPSTFSLSFYRKCYVIVFPSTHMWFYYWKVLSHYVVIPLVFNIIYLKIILISILLNNFNFNTFYIFYINNFI
jgi:hypothetical protein